MLSFHSLLIAAIFTTYMLTMVMLFAYIWHTSRERERGEDERDPGPAFHPAAA